LTLQEDIVEITISCLRHIIYSFIDYWTPDILAATGWQGPEDGKLKDYCEVVSTYCPVPPDVFAPDAMSNAWFERVKFLPVYETNSLTVVDLYRAVQEAYDIAMALEGDPAGEDMVGNLQ
jgi:hypothetical protein